MSNLNKLVKGAGVFLLYILVPYIIDMFLPSITSSNTTELIYRFAFMFLLLLFFIFLYKDDIVRDIKAFSPKLIGKSLLYFIILIVGFFLVATVLFIVYPDFSYTNSAIMDSLLQKNFALMIFYVFIISLFTEQIVFRKVFKEILNNKYFFIVFSGIIYGVFQVGYNISSINDVLTIIPFAFAGIILSTSYEKTNNILTPCLVYLFYDLFILIGSAL